MNSLQLSPHEARVLGTLMEKARTVPDSYPLSLNALLLGCNQKTSREPLLTLSEQDALQALESLLQRHLVLVASGNRVTRYSHNFHRVTGLAEGPSVLMGLLLLRGAQTAAELRANADRWYRFESVAAVEEHLQTLQADAAPMACKLPRMPGAREARWMHLLCGPPPSANTSPDTDAGNPLPARMPGLAQDWAALQERVQALEGRVQDLETLLLSR
ncbi:MAG: YceH family protein [Burkholderiaceae bacterium]